MIVTPCGIIIGHHGFGGVRVAAASKGRMRSENAEIYRKHAEDLIRFATVLVGPSAAEDVVADAVTHAFGSPAWPSVTHHRAYLFRATLNQARQRFRADRRRIRRELFSTPPAPNSDPGIRAEVIDAMRRLTPRQRAVIFFTYWHDLECGEVGELLAISPRTVQRELTAARRHLEVLLR